MGRRSKYDKDKLILVAGWARDGLTEKQIAKNLGISLATLSTWKLKIPEFLDAIKKGKEIVDYEVENALLMAALGHMQTEQAVTNKGDVVSVQRYFPPNVTALIFWLKNRKPQVWRDRRETANVDAPEQQDNGFVAALNAAAPDVWSEDEEGPADGEPPGE